MARRGITEAKMLLLRGAKRAESGVSKFSGTCQHGGGEGAAAAKSSSSGMIGDSSCWVPHPRTGIYFPKGHEWIMDDVPDGAASFSQTYWLRNVDGVDIPSTKA